MNSVIVKANGKGNRTIVLKNSSNEILQSKTILIENGTSRIDLGFNIDPGINYHLGVVGPNVNLGRSNSNIKYPYTIDNVISIKRSNADNQGYDYYYFFYNWEIKLKDCLVNKNKIIVKSKEINTPIKINSINI